MKQSTPIILFLCIAFFANTTLAQDVLPEFKLKTIAPGKVSISWHNPNLNCVNLSVQRSEDNKKFKTIITAKHPALYENSFTDTRALKNKVSFYRIQYTLKGGNNNFSKIHSTSEKQVVPIRNPPNWSASHFVYSNQSGYIQIQLNDPTSHNYHLIFFEETGKEIFQMKKIESDNLVLDKTNFPHSGWYTFELYKDEKLFEKNQVYLIGN